MKKLTYMKALRAIVILGCLAFCGEAFAQQIDRVYKENGVWKSAIVESGNVIR